MESEPFTKTDLLNAGQFFNFAKKCEAILDEVVGAVEAQIQKIFDVKSEKSGFTSGHFSPTYNSAYSYTHKFRYGVATCLYLSLDPWEDELGFCVSANVPRRDMYKLIRQLNWEQYKSEIFSWHPVKADVQPRH